MSDPRPASTDPTIAPYLVVTNADEVIEFLTHAYGATTRARLTRTDGTVMHAEVCIGDSVVMIGEAMEKMAMRGLPASV